MSEVTFKYPVGIDVICQQTGIKGSIAGRSELLNGCVRYDIQPRKKETESGCPEQWEIDEQNIKPIKGKYNPSFYKFQYRTGDRVKSLINGFVGIIVKRSISLNGCEEYMVEGEFSKDNKRIRVGFFVQEVKFIDSGLNKTLEKEKKYVGCSAARKEKW